MDNTEQVSQGRVAPCEGRPWITPSNAATSVNDIEEHETNTQISQTGESKDNEAPPDHVLNIKAFLATLNNRPVFTR